MKEIVPIPRLEPLGKAAAWIFATSIEPSRPGAVFWEAVI